MDDHPERVPWVRRLGRRFRWIGEERGERWQSGAESLRRGFLIVFWAVAILWLGFWALYIINLSPLWMRAFSECTARQPESNTVVEMFRHKQECGDFASRVVEENSKMSPR